MVPANAKVGYALEGETQQHARRKREKGWGALRREGQKRNDTAVFCWGESEPTANSKGG